MLPRGKQWVAPTFLHKKFARNVLPSSYGRWRYRGVWRWEVIVRWHPGKVESLVGTLRSHSSFVRRFLVVVFKRRFCKSKSWQKRQGGCKDVTISIVHIYISYLNIYIYTWMYNIVIYVYTCLYLYIRYILDIYIFMITYTCDSILLFPTLPTLPICTGWCTLRSTWDNTKLLSKSTSNV